MEQNVVQLMSNAIGKAGSWILGSGLIGFTGVEVYKEVRKRLDKRAAKQRRQRNIYVLRGMGTVPDAHELAPDLRGHRFDTSTIANRVYLVMAEEIFGDVPLAAVLHQQAAREQEQRRKQYMEQAKRLQLPGLHLSREARENQMRPILHEMVEDEMLTFLPPDNWMIKA